MLIKQVIICSYIEVCARVTGGHTLANIPVRHFAHGWVALAIYSKQSVLFMFFK